MPDRALPQGESGEFVAMLERAKALRRPKARNHVKERKNCGAPIGRIPSRDKGPVGAPLMRRYFRPLSTAYPCHALHREKRSRRPLGFHPARRVVVGDPGG